MAYARCAPLTVFLFATLLMFPAKKVAGCSGFCSELFEDEPCGGSTHCLCFPPTAVAGICINPGSQASLAKMMDAHPNICQSNDECIKKGSGNLCARYRSTEYGWCINSDGVELHKGFLKMPAAIAQ